MSDVPGDQGMMVSMKWLRWATGLLRRVEQGLATQQQGTPLQRPMVNGGGPRGMIPCSLTQTGGSAGSSSTTCSFTYTASPISGSGDNYGTALSPHDQSYRIPDVTMNAASEGEGYWLNGNFVLARAYETIAAVVACSS